jgi:hypothetical protein
VRLNGWQRLWVLVCILYSVLVVLFAWADYGDETRVRTSDVQLSQSSTKAIAIGLAMERNKQRVAKIEFPDGTILSLDPKTPDDEQEQVAAEYWDAVESVKPSKRLRFTGLVAAFWIIPCITLYILGWAIGWVYRGFK